MRRKSILIISICLGLMLLTALGYTEWNRASPERTCASCHEIVPALEIWQQSSHREVTCTDCHGKTLGSGFHSIKERSRMVVAHFRKSGGSMVPKLDEGDVLKVMEACVGCHRDEQRSWLAGGHSATYSDIFLNEEQNRMERLYPDCFRCHGMYYGGTIGDLVEPISTTGPWSLKDPDQSGRPVIPCLVCHPVHLENEPRAHPASLDDPEALFYERIPRGELTGLYLRSDRMHLGSDHLPRPDIYHKGRKVLVSDDPVQRICMQCHAPNWAHEAGTEDDKTPTGVHEGISCRACHRGHSNDPRDACKTCHPAVTSCNLDVMTMNTTYMNRNSPNNLHSMECVDCHEPVPSGSKTDAAP
jgi:hypothetical protein